MASPQSPEHNREDYSMDLLFWLIPIAIGWGVWSFVVEPMLSARRAARHERELRDLNKRN